MSKYDLESLFKSDSGIFLRVRFEGLYSVPLKRIKIERLLEEITNEIERTKELNETINQIKNRDSRSSKC
jgi:hypothetical protein